MGKAFGSAKRLELIELLSQGERTVEALAREAGMGVSTVSAHLQVLKLSEPGDHPPRGHQDPLPARRGRRGRVSTPRCGMVAREHSADVDRALASYLAVGSLGDSDADVQEISREQLLERLAAGKVVLLDVRPAEEYAAGHIPGARSVPFGSLAEEVEARSTCPRAREVVAYCRGAYCVLAHDAVRLLRSHGVPSRRLQDGLLEWRTQGHPVDVA